jgi:hypothetical protein
MTLVAPAKAQPALYAGIAIGVLSALPIISLGNCVCCMWVVGGGMLAVYLMQQNYPYSVTTADGALVGLMAGAIGGAIAALLSIPLMMAMGPFQQQVFNRIAENPDIPEQTRDLIRSIGASGAMGGLIALKVVIGLAQACIMAIFGLLGGLLGVALFKKKDAPPPPGTTEVLPPA